MSVPWKAAPDKGGRWWVWTEDEPYWRLVTLEEKRWVSTDIIYYEVVNAEDPVLVDSITIDGRLCGHPAFWIECPEPEISPDDMDGVLEDRIDYEILELEAL